MKQYRFYRNINTPYSKAILSLELGENPPYYYSIAVHEPIEIESIGDSLPDASPTTKKMEFKLTVRHTEFRSLFEDEPLRVEEVCYVMVNPLKRVK
jgi:hypothetical protein